MNAWHGDDHDASLPDSLRLVAYRHAPIYDAPEWYDVDYAGYRGEERFYRSVITQHVRPGGAVVELGIGTGRLALQLVQDGYSVHGVEPASAMRARLEEKVRRMGGRSGSLHVEDAHAHDFVGPPCRIDVITFPFNGVLHLDSHEALCASFRHVHRRLAPSGRFAMDCTGPYWGTMLLGRVPWGRCDERIHPESGVRVHTCDRSLYLDATRQLHIDIRYALQGASEGIQVKLTQTMWTWQQLLAALERSGFVIDNVYGDVDLTPFDEGSPRLLVSCRKASDHAR